MIETIEKLENTRNSITVFDGFYISYNPFCNLSMEGEPNRKEDETALVKDGKFYILYGNYEREMVEAARTGGFEAAKKIFDSRPDEHSFWSN
jgi:hypothetical protein